MEANLSFGINELWGRTNFIKKDIGIINFLVGPNGTGKSLFGEKVLQNMGRLGLKARMLNAERLTGFERQNYDQISHSNFQKGLNIDNYSWYRHNGPIFGLSADAYIILQQRLDVKIKVEALLSDIFQKHIRLHEKGGFLVPTMIDTFGGGIEYNLKERECHGLKELIALLAILYDDEYNCLIIDEPELHLHPQFQSFFMREIRKYAGEPRNDPQKKIFFIITHSPYFVDLKNLEDLRNIILFHPKSIPTFIDKLEGDDEFRIKKFLPLLNTHHKQFFFSPNPVFVEGYTDQHFFSTLLEKLENNIGASGACLIDVGGKDPLDVFFRLCSRLKIDARFITDIDAIFSGKLVGTIVKDERFQKFMTINGLGSEPREIIGDFERKISDLVRKLIQSDEIQRSLPDEMTLLINLSTDLPKQRRVALQIIINKLQLIKSIIPSESNLLESIIGKFKKIVQGFESCNTFILTKGALENYYTQSTASYIINDQKDKLLDIECNYILQHENIAELKEKYMELLEIISRAIPIVDIKLKTHLKYILLEWIQRVQLLVQKGEILRKEDLLQHAEINYTTYNKIFDIMDFRLNPDKQFSCKIQLKTNVDSGLSEIEFNEKLLPKDFNF